MLHETESSIRTYYGRSVTKIKAKGVKHFQSVLVLPNTMEENRDSDIFRLAVGPRGLQVQLKSLFPAFSVFRYIPFKTQGIRRFKLLHSG